MKKLLLLLLFIPLMSFGQDVNLNLDKKVEFTEKEEVISDLGLKYLGNGLYRYSIEAVRRLGWKPVTEKEWAKRTLEFKKFINEFTNLNTYSYKTFNVQKISPDSKELKALLIVQFKLFDKDGALVLNKDDAKKQLIELKGYLDLGIITQKEYDEKAVSLKKILLGN